MQMIGLIAWGLIAIVFVLSYFFKKKVDISNLILLFASLLFAAYADFRYALVLIAMAVVTWWSARHDRFFWVGIVAAIAALFYFKYVGFFVDSFAKIFDVENPIAGKVILPLGISFYSFSAISYLVDVRMGKVDAKCFHMVALYLSFFPKLTAGPIQRSGDFFAQTEKPRNIGRDSLFVGIQIMVFGMFKKLVLADHLSVFVNQVYETPNVFSGLTVLLATFAYSFQIYFDFSGYSDIAIGAAKILGIDLPRNFNLPYLSMNVTELWKRWHITLSSWLQDYLYITLGGNRKGRFRTYVNLVMTMLLGGLWHGANWTYIFWGLLHGIALVVHKCWRNVKTKKNIRLGRIGEIFSIVGTFCFVNLCWVFFRADSVGHAIAIVTRALSFQPGITQVYFWLIVAAVIWGIAAVVAVAKSDRKRLEGFYPLVDLNNFWGLVAFFCFCGLTFGLAYTGGSPFIYGNY